MTAFHFSISATFPTNAPSLRGYSRVMFCEFVAFCAMSFHLLFSSTSHSSKSEAGSKDAFARVKNFGKCQTLFSPFNNGISLESAQVGQLNSLESDAINHDKPCYSLVSLLLAFCRPFAIIWFVIAVVIYSLNGVFWWALSHVFNEAIKRLPSLTNGNTAPAIIRPCFACTIVAAVKHSSPNVIKRMDGLRVHLLLLLKRCALSIACSVTGKEA